MFTMLYQYFQDIWHKIKAILDVHVGSCHGNCVLTMSIHTRIPRCQLVHGRVHIALIKPFTFMLYNIMQFHLHLLKSVSLYNMIILLHVFILFCFFNLLWDFPTWNAASLIVKYCVECNFWFWISVWNLNLICEEVSHWDKVETSITTPSTPSPNPTNWIIEPLVWLNHIFASGKPW